MKDDPVIQGMIILPPNEYTPETAEKLARAFRCHGLTKREYFALHMMQAICEHRKIGLKVKEKAQIAIHYADTLLEELAKGG